MKKAFYIFLLLLVLSGCKSKTSATSQTALKSASDEPAYGDTLIEGTIGEPSILIPMLAGDSASHNIAGIIFNGLVKYDTDLSVIGDLAESWDISHDGLVITFHLRKGVKWADGVEFTADDVMFGYKTIIDEKTPTAYSEDFRQVRKAEVLDKYTFRVTYEKPFAPALTSWGNLVVLPKHLLEGKDITKSELARNPVGMGPYKLNKWTSGQELALDAYQDYFEGRPYINHYIYRVIPDSATMFLELQAGGIDMMGLTPIQYTKQTETDFFKSNFQKFRYPAFAYTYMGLNLKHPFFKDKQVRQAIAYAIDKSEIVDVVLFGLGSPSTGPYVPNTWPYNPNVKKYEYNPEKAMQFLKEAGWKDTDGDGILDRDGKPFEFTILTNMGNTLRMNTATIIQWRLAKVGIKVEIRALEWSTFINEFIDKRCFQAVILGWSIGLDPDQFDIWHSSKTKEKEFNFVSYRNPEVDELLDRGRRTFDITERKKAYFRIQEILADELPYIFLYVPDATPIVQARFRGIKPSPTGITYNLPKWYVPKKLQRHTLEP
ncbi:MAG: peptide-binding protein [Nitrospira bacterium HGW-Nitrospira-1]|nr:MAG: peptide-binding protein [Nitrospira bacterium HGW-Nitrospira-1]